jgi:hypothetical protein
MAVTFDTCAGIQASSTTSPRTWTHTIGPGQYGLLMVEIELEVQGDPGTASIQSVTYAGQAMTLLASVGPGGAPQTCIYWYYLLSPPSGANTVSITWTYVYYTEIKATSRSYFGVDPSTPFGTVATLAWGQTATPSVNAASAADEVVIDFLGVLSDGEGGTMSVGAGQTARFSEAVPTPGGSKAIGGSDEAGAPSVTMSWTLSRATYYSAMMAVSLRPFVVTRTRLVDYQIDEWDPDFGIQDAQGRRLDAWSSARPFRRLRRTSVSFTIRGWPT